MSSNCILAWPAYVVLSFIHSVCITVHCDTVPSSYILVFLNVIISTVLTVVCHELVTNVWCSVSSQMNKMSLIQTDFCQCSEKTVKSIMEFTVSSISREWVPNIFQKKKKIQDFSKNLFSSLITWVYTWYQIESCNTKQ